MTVGPALVADAGAPLGGEPSGGLDRWETLTAKHQPAWDPTQLAAVRRELSDVPPLVFAGEELERGLVERLPELATRVTVLGHLLRGGTPTAYDRILGTRSGLSAVRAIAEGNFGTMAALRGTEVIQVPFADATRELKTVPPARLAEIAQVSG